MKMDVFEVRFGCWKHLARYGAHVDSFGITILNLDPQRPEGPSATMVLKLGLSETAMEAEHDSLTFWNRMSLYTERCLDDPRCMMYGHVWTTKPCLLQSISTKTYRVISHAVRTPGSPWRR